MKIGTDAVMLGALAFGSHAEGASLLDIGSGSGILALMMAQRIPGLRVTAIEIDPAAAGDARENISQSPFHDRITLVEGDILTHQGRYDLIISNPPFFNQNLRSPDPRRAVSRHGTDFDVIRLIEIAPKLLTSRGVMALIAPADRDDEISLTCELNRLHVTAKTFIRPGRDKPPYRIIYHLSPSAEVQLHLPETITIGSSEYHQLTKDFYL